MVSGVVWINGKTYYLAHRTVERWQRALSVSTEFLYVENDGTSFGGRKPRPARSFEVKVAEDGTMTILETTNADTPKLNSRTSKERRHSGGGGSETPSVVPSDAPATKEPTENPTSTVKPTQPEETEGDTTTEPPQPTTEPSQPTTEPSQPTTQPTDP